MNTPQLPSVELIQGTSAPPAARQHHNPRWKIFFGVLLVTAAIGIAFVYARSPVYRAAASVLTVKPKAVDTRSADADIEHVAIQGRLLLGEDLLERLRQRLAEDVEYAPLGLDALRSMLSVVPVPETNLLELRAEGVDPGQLQHVVNRWAEAYETFRADEIAAATGRTMAELQEQQDALRVRVEQAREELQAFREQNEIVGLERGENRSLAALKGLNESLNKARDKLVEARARRMAVDAAIAEGDTVVPSEHKAEITKMQLALQRARIRLADLRQRYTEHYIERDPVLRTLPGEVRAMEDELKHALELAAVSVRDEAQQEVETARVAVATLEQQLAEHQGEVQQFNDRFKEFKALEENLARLDTLYADNQQRLAQIEVSNFRRYPQIQVVEWARLPNHPIYPDYERDLLIALGFAVGLALFVTWLFEYLAGRDQAAQAAPYVGVRIITGDQSGPLRIAGDDRERLVHEPPQPAAPANDGAPPHLVALPRELNGTEVRALLAVCDAPTAAYAALLLSGVSPYELPLLHRDCFDGNDRVVEIPGANRRSVALDGDAWRRINALPADMDRQQMAIPVAELNERLRHAAEIAPLNDPASVNALALWHSYVVYLVRQGIAPGDLDARVGPVPPEIRQALAHYAPPGESRPASALRMTHPALLG